MRVLAVVVLAAILVPVALIGFGPSRSRAFRRRRPAEGGRTPGPYRYDPGRERRAEARARELLRSIVGEADYRMYDSLGFLHVDGAAGQRGDSRYGYLIYPHRPIVSYDADSGELLSEYCVTFPDRDEPVHGARLPDADDVLAKWMALHGDERRLMEDANMHLPGRQLDPELVSRDLRRLADWQASR
ncbi:MAG: hypothetical protein ACR2N5_07850 [Solirubrobacterales bacterium]